MTEGVKVDKEISDEIVAIRSKFVDQIFNGDNILDIRSGVFRPVITEDVFEILLAKEAEFEGIMISKKLADHIFREMEKHPTPLEEFVTKLVGSKDRLLPVFRNLRKLLSPHGITLEAFKAGENSFKLEGTMNGKTYVFAAVSFHWGIPGSN